MPGGPHLPTVVAPDEVTGPRYVNFARQFDPAAYGMLKARAAARGTTVAMVLLGAYAHVLAAWSDNQRFLVNMPVYARDSGEDGIEDVVSDFSDILLLEFDGRQTQTFEESLEQVTRQFLADMDHRSFNGVAVQQAVAAAGGPQNGLAPFVFACNLGEQLLSAEAEESLGRLAYMTSQTPQVQIDFQAFDHEKGLRLSWDAAAELYPQGMVEAMFEALCSFVSLLASTENAWSLVPSIMPPEQRSRRMAEIDALRSATPDRAPLHAAFVAHAESNPEATALINAETGQPVSYGEVLRRSAGVARMLADGGVPRGSLVAVSLERGPAQVCALIGTVMAGCAYVPIDVSQPEARKSLMRDKLQLRHLIASRRDAGAGTLFEQAFAIEDAPAETSTAQAAELARSRMPRPEDTAYVVMTSGSTGDPKGVELSHGAAWNTISDVNARLGVAEGDRMLGVSNFDFDLSVYDVFGILGAGATLVVMPETARRDAFRELEYVRRYGITLWNTVPLLLDMLVTAAESTGDALPLRAVALSGDWIGLDLPERLAALAPDCRIAAMGGATEAAIWSNWQEVTLPLPDYWTSIPYGRPLRSQCYRVVDARGEDRPDWAAGELLIGGAGVAEGYRGDEELSGQRFFVGHGTRWYRTGDMGRIWEDGTIEFLGRRDFQVKVRGHRIELGEVETAIASHPDIAACAACPSRDARSLAAIVQTRPGVELDAEELKAFLELRLPDYMVPARFVAVDALPLAANGKLDRRKAAELAQAQAELPRPEEDAPRDGAEQDIADIWMQAIGASSITRTDNYFEIGGNSLTAVKVISAVRERFGVKVDTADVFAHATIPSFARLVNDRIASRDAQESGASSPACDELPTLAACGAEDGEEFDLTPLQRAYLIGRQSDMVLGGQSTRAYFEVAVSNLDMAHLNRAMAKLAKEQGVLRLSVNVDKLTQTIQRQIPPVAIPLTDVSYLNEGEWAQFLESKRAELFEREFDLKRAPLWSLEATRWNDDWHLHFCHDGMILDGWSAERFFDLLEKAYCDEPAGCDVTYRDYVQWLDRVRESEAYERDREYWLDKAAGFPDEQALEPLVAPESITNPQVANETRSLSDELCGKVRAAAAARGMTAFSVMLAAFGKALEACGGRHEFLINTPVAFRPQTGEAAELLGECSDFRLFRFASEPDDTLWATAAQVAAQLADESKHAAYRGTDLTRAMQQRTGASIAAPIVFTSTADIQAGASAWYRKVMSRTHTSQVWLDAVVMPAASGLTLSIDYVEGLLDAQTVKHVADSFLGALQLLESPDDPWGRLSALPLSQEDRALIDAANDTREDLEERSYAPFLRSALTKHADRLFVRGGANPMTYRQLEEAMARIGSAVEAAAAEAGAEDRAGVGIMLGKGAPQIAAALACAASGRPFMPIDTEYPASAVRRCVEAAGLALVLVDDETEKGAPSGTPTVNVNRDLPEHGELTWRESAGSDVIAYINTSGSTGYPKSIRITHEGVVNCLLWSNERFGVTEESCAIALTNFAHDMALYDTLGMVIAGAGVVVLGEDTRREPRAWARLVDECGVTIWNSVPAFMRMLFEAGSPIGDQARRSLACVIHGGDWLDPELARTITETFPHARLFNVGGPTETTIWNIAHEVTEGDLTGEIPYGKPIQNTRYHVFDDRMNECPVGVAGTMFVSGVGVSPGYAGTDDGGRVFSTWNGESVCCTGDRGLVLPNGELRILGRADLQVKVNGKRIELGGIERLLGQVEGVSACAITVNEGTGRLVAHYEGAGAPGESVLREELARKLPQYMVPTRLVALESLPLTRNGKPDRKLLAKLELPAQAAEAPDEPAPAQAADAAPAPASDPLEEMLLFCREVIGDDTIGPDDNFFEVGGDSLAAMKIGSWAYDRFGTELSVVTIMTQPTVREWMQTVA